MGGVGSGRPRQTHCNRGHPLSGRNLTVTPNGHRLCRACRHIRDGSAPRQKARRCKRGHPLWGKNVGGLNSNWRRCCRACKRMTLRRRLGQPELAGKRIGYANSSWKWKRHCKRGHKISGNTRYERACKVCESERDRIVLHIEHLVFLDRSTTGLVSGYAEIGWDVRNIITRALALRAKLQRTDPWQLGRRRLRALRSEMSKLGVRRGNPGAWLLQTGASRPAPTSRA